MPQDDLLQQAIGNIRGQQVAPPADAGVPSDDVLQQAISRLSPKQEATKPRDEDMFRAPAWAQKEPIRTLTGIGQELAETAYKVPRLFGVDIGRPPKAVETGLPEKIGAGAVEYGLGAGALKAAAPIQKALETLGKIPKIGRMLVSPIAQRAAGAAAMGAVETPEKPLKGAEIGAALSPLLDLGLASPKLLRPAFNKLRLSPTLLRPTVKKEFNSLVDTTASKLGIKKGQDVEKAAFDKLSSEYEGLQKQAGKLYESAEKTLEGVPYSTENVRRILNEEMVAMEGSADPFDRKAYRSLNSLQQKINNPAEFLRELNREKRSAYKAGNFNLIDPLEKIGENFEEAIRRDSQLPGNEKLVSGMEKLKEASDFFKENIVPFRQRGVELTEYGKRRPTLTEFFKAHSAGTSKGLLNKIGSNIQDLQHLERISPEMKDYFALSEFKKGFNDADKFIKSFKNLSDEQKNVYYTPEQLDRFEKFSNLHEEHPEIFEKAKRPLPIEEVPFLSLRGLGISAIPKEILGRLGKTGVAPSALESELERSASTSPLLAGLAKGGLLGAFLPMEEQR